MMHYQGFVVTLRDGNNKTPYREYDHTRRNQHSSARVMIPADHEFAIGFKVLDQYRRRVEITIDGTLVASNLIVNFGESILERFLDSDKKFKVVRANLHESADPSNIENGKVVIRAWKERSFQTYTSVLRSARLPNFDPNFETVYANSMGPITLSANNVKCYGDQAAVAEGSISHQHIPTTTWSGDANTDPSETFTFIIRIPTGNNDTNFCHICGTKLVNGANFCQNCGAKI